MEWQWVQNGTSKNAEIHSTDRDDQSKPTSRAPCRTGSLVGKKEVVSYNEAPFGRKIYCMLYIDDNIDLIKEQRNGLGL